MERLDNTEKIPLKNQLTSFLEKIDFKFKITRDDEEKYIIHTGVSLNVGNSDAFICVHNKLRLVELFAYAPIKIPENRRNEVAKFLDFADSISYLGNLQLNHREGDLRCKTYFLEGQSLIDERIIHDSIYELFNQLERFLPFVLKISFGGYDAERAEHEFTKSVNPRDN